MVTKLAYKLILIFILLLVFLVISSSLKDVKFISVADEGYYLKFAYRIGQDGLSGFQVLFKEFLSNQNDWRFPNPLRVGFIILSTLWLNIFDFSYTAMAYFSLICYLLSLYVSYYFSRKYLGERFALLFLILLAFSPLQLAMSRRALMDSAVNLTSVLSLWLFWNFIKERKALKLVIFIAAYSLSLLIKETAALLIFIFLPVMAVEKFIYKRKMPLKYFFAVSLAPFLLASLVYLSLGCLTFVPQILNIILNSPKTNIGAILYCSGPWFRYLIDYILLSPWVVILAIGFVINYFLEERKDELTFYFIFAYLTCLLLFSFFIKNVRYVIVLDMPMRLFSVFVLERLSRKISIHYAFSIALFLVVILAMLDLANFYSLFVFENIYDPVSFFLLRAHHIIPFK